MRESCGERESLCVREQRSFLVREREREREREIERDIAFVFVCERERSK